jgi:hypothetical protein
MQRILLSALVAVGMTVGIFPVWHGSDAMRSPADYPLVCRGGGNLAIGAAPGDGNIGFVFTRGTKPAGDGLAPGECSWTDRGMYGNEPDRVSQHVADGSESLKVGGTLAPENRWYEELHSANNYWTFQVSNNGRGQLIVSSARPNAETTQGPLLRIPVPQARQESERTASQVGNPELAQLQLAQVQSIRLACTNADIASLQIRTTAGSTFWSHSSCFPYTCETDTKTCATSCADPGGCATGMDCVGGRCVFPRTFCSDNHTSMNSRGAKNNCNAYGCDPVTGLCRTVCTSSDQCNPSISALCDIPTKSCVLP